MLALARDKRMINCMLSGPLGLGTDLSTVLERHLKNHFIDDVIVFSFLLPEEGLEKEDIPEGSVDNGPLWHCNDDAEIDELEEAVEKRLARSNLESLLSLSL